MGNIKTKEEEEVKMVKNEKSNGSVTDKVKKELGFMKEGAKVLPRVLAKKGKQWFKDQVKTARENARMEREIEKAAREAEREAYKEERIKQAKIRGIAKGKKRTLGARGTLAELGKIGDRMSVSNLLGMEDVQGKEKKVGMSASEFMFSGLGEKKKKKEK